MIIVISNPTSIVKEHAIINQLFDEGLETFHLRKKLYSENEIKKFIELISEKYFKRIVLHTNYHLAKEYNMKGIHVPAVSNYKSSKGSLSISFHSINEIEKSDKTFDYGFLSPLFDSISKAGYKSKFDLEEVKVFLQKHKSHNNKSGDPSENVKGKLREQIIALGGIDIDKIDNVKELGFSGIALMGAIWQSENPIEKFKLIKEKWLLKEPMF